MQIKNIKDYYELLYEKFPDVPQSDIRKIVNYGWKSLYMHNSYGGDVIINLPNFMCIFGTLHKDPIAHFKYYIKKLAVKLRVLYRRYNCEWDGYYYFALTDEQFEDYLRQKNKKGRKRKLFTFHNIALFKLYEECRLKSSGNKYIFRTPFISDAGFFMLKDEFKPLEVEHIVTHDPLTLKDILVENYKYDILNGNSSK